MSITVFGMSEALAVQADEKKANTPPALKQFNDNLSIGVLATELLERMAQGKIPSHPLQTSAYLRPEKTQAITHAILDLTGFPISNSRAAHGLSLPTGNDIAIAKTFITAANMAFVAVINNSDSAIQDAPALGIHSSWICSTAKGAIDSARNLAGIPTSPTQSDDVIPKKRVTLIAGGATFGKPVRKLSFI